jgi:hypothetical protein
MTVYHQMGNDSHNLLHVAELNRFQGAILSPVNDDVAALTGAVGLARRDREGFEMIFDPQLYVPASNRGQLPHWEYFPADVDTADLSAVPWWARLMERLCRDCDSFRPHAICSPSYIPNVFNNAYFDSQVRVGDVLVSQLAGSGIEPLQTAIVGLGDLTVPHRAAEIASILSRTRAPRIYLVLVGTTDPRRELANRDELKGAMRLISFLENAGLRVLVGFSSTEMVLWKAAGAAACATGKFFNLRRFTRSRFDEPSSGGGQLPYWFEEQVMGFLREGDLMRMREEGRLSEASIRNPFGLQILHQLDNDPGRAWVALSWRQYLYAFADLEHRIATQEISVRSLLKSADDTWGELEDEDFLMEERRNDGQWLRAWRQALTEFAR